MAVYGTFATVREQVARTPDFSTAFAYVEELLRAGSAAQSRLRAIAPGETHKVDLGGGVFVIEQAFESKPRSEGFFESHRKHVDVQVVLDGPELIEVADSSGMKVREPFNPERDLVTYEDNPQASMLRLLSGQVVIFYPNDAHMPTLRAGAEAVLVRKAVVKVPLAT